MQPRNRTAVSDLARIEPVDDIDSCSLVYGDDEDPEDEDYMTMIEDAIERGELP